MNLIDFELRGEHITLDALLKATGLAPSGGAAKLMVAQGKVQVDGRDELRKTCKIRAGQVVAVAGARISVAAEGGGEGAPADSAQNL
ncbi:MAG TPA: RNA-binding S4 domain-containing protein [Burkholderiaceae bacterium]|nr:RNA-binding S4 domain-containing protein [Burkholderiaceae bacterium]